MAYGQKTQPTWKSLLLRELRQQQSVELSRDLDQL